jgi:isopentenyl-diphosphate delta-isomerase
MQLFEESRNLVVLVNEQGEIVGYEDKLKAHQSGALHKAFSVFILNHKDEMLLQQRGLKKYHFAGLWSNACCSHPMPEEDLKQAAHRRLQEEMGFDTSLKEVYSFIYKALDAKSGLYEHELDFIFVGYYEGDIQPDPEEVNAYQWIKLDQLYQEVAQEPEKFTEWFKICLSTFQQKKLLYFQAV